MISIYFIFEEYSLRLTNNRRLQNSNSFLIGYYDTLYNIYHKDVQYYRKKDIAIFFRTVYTYEYFINMNNPI